MLLMLSNPGGKREKMNLILNLMLKEQEMMEKDH